MAPPAVHLTALAAGLRKDIAVAAQDAFPSTGAHTGETPSALLKDMGVRYTLVGHSERRQKYESNELVAAKAKAAIADGMTVIACLGETLEQREAGKTFDVVTQQLAVRAWRAAVGGAWATAWRLGAAVTAPGGDRRQAGGGPG